MWIEGLPYHYLPMRRTADRRPWVHPIGLFGATFRRAAAGTPDLRPEWVRQVVALAERRAGGESDSPGSLESQE